MDGEYWTPALATAAASAVATLPSAPSDGDSDTESILGDGASSSAARGCRDMSKCFTNGQRIRHVIGTAQIWIGTYRKDRNSIFISVNGVEQFYSLNKFVGMHYRAERPDRTDRANAWRECECEMPDGSWISTYSLPSFGSH